MTDYIPTWQRFWRIRQVAAINTAVTGGAEWNIGGNGGGAAGWLDLPVSKDQDGFQPQKTLIYPTPAAGVRSMNTADPIAGAHAAELGTLEMPVWPELIDRILWAVTGGVSRLETAGSAALASTAFASVATLDTQPNGTEQLKFVIASSTAASAAKINIIQSTVIQETIEIGTNAGTVNGTYYSKGAYNGSVNAITFSIEGTVTGGMVTVSGVDYVTSEFAQDDDTPWLQIEQAGRVEAGTGDSEYFPGVVIPSVQFSYDRSAVDGLLLASFPVLGLPATHETAGTYQNDTAKYYKPFAGWNAAITIDGSSYAEVVSANFTIQTNNELHATSSGTQAPTGKVEGEIEVFGELVILPADDARYLDHLAATPRALGIDFNTPHYVVDTTTYRLLFEISRCFIGNYNRGRQNMAQAATLQFRGVYNATDAGAALITKRDRMPV